MSFVGEEGIDEGGVRKEFFQLLTSQLFDIQYGMFTYINNGRYFWFNKQCIWFTNNDYQLVGILFGLALYNNVILDVSFPLALYKKILNIPLKLNDLTEFDMELYTGLKQLLNYSPKEDIQYIYCRNFDVTYDDLGVTKTIELVPNGSEIEVTGDNRELYVEKYINWIMNDSISKQYNEFLLGFKRVMNINTLNILLRADELQLLICGQQELNFYDLESTTTYIGSGNETEENIWNRNHKTIQYFWEVVHDMSIEEKKKFLFFFTGSMKAPLGGLSKINMKIQRMGPDSMQLPTSHTCFNVLLLPEYSTKESLKIRLLQAINETEGFGLR